MMNRTDIRFLALALIGTIAVGASAVASTEMSPATGTANGVACEIMAANANGMTQIEPVVYGDPDVTGSYSFRVASSGHGGRSNISQGGSFEIPSSGAMTLGRVALGSGGNYDAVLTIDVAGASTTCEARV